MELTREICRAANRIYLAARFSIASDCPEASRRTVLKAIRDGQDMFVRVDPFWLRTSYTTVVGDTSSGVVDKHFQSTVSDLLHRLRVHQLPIARLGTSLCAWNGVGVPYGELGNSLDSLNFIFNGEQDSVCDLLLEHRTKETKLLAFSNMYYGLAVVIAAINSRPNELRGFRQEIGSAGAAIVVNSSLHFSQAAC